MAGVRKRQTARSGHESTATALEARSTTPSTTVNPTKVLPTSRDGNAWRAYLKEITSNSTKLLEAYKNILQIWPQSGEIWSQYLQSTMQSGDSGVDKLFQQCLLEVPDVSVWKLYLTHVQSKPDVENSQIKQCFQYALAHVKHDPSSGEIWQQYISFLTGLPVSTSWDEQHRMDELRKAYQSAVQLPLSNIESLWRAYDSFENHISRATARKFVDERSAAYMLARSVVREYKTLTANTAVARNNTLPSIDDDFSGDLREWRQYLSWEASNPLKLSDEGLKDRILYIYKRAVVCLRWTPQIWFDAANAYPETDVRRDLLQAGLVANPRSFLLSLSLSQSYELAKSHEEAEQVLRRLLETFGDNDPEGCSMVFIELMRIENRSSKGIKAARMVASECWNTLGESTIHQVYVALADLEWWAGNSQVATKVYRLAYHKFSENADFVHSYLGFLLRQGDLTNARVVFEKASLSFADDPNALRPLFDAYMQAENASGVSLESLAQLEARYSELYGVDRLTIFSRRYASSTAKAAASDLILGTEMNVNGSGVNGSGTVADIASAKLLLPTSMTSLLDSLPPADVYDGPSIITTRLIDLVQQYV